MPEPVNFEDLPPAVWFKGYPPLPGESSRAYRARIEHDVILARRRENYLFWGLFIATLVAFGYMLCAIWAGDELGSSLAFAAAAVFGTMAWVKS